MTLRLAANKAPDHTRPIKPLEPLGVEAFVARHTGRPAERARSSRMAAMWFRTARWSL